MRFPAAIVVLLLALAMPAAASAGQVSKSGATLVYEADQGGATDGDQLDIRMEGDAVVFEDVVLVLTQGFGNPCTSEASGRRLRCPATGVTNIEVNNHRTPSGGERFTAAASFPLPLDMSTSPGDGYAVALTGGAAGDSLTTCNFCPTVLAGNGGNDVMTGGAASDLITGGPGADIIIAGGGEDVIRYDDAARTAGVVVDLAAAGGVQGGPDDGPPGARDSVAQAEIVVGSPFDDVIRSCRGQFPNGCVGGDGNDELAGVDGHDDRLEGGNGNDTLIGLGGGDTLLAGDGDDVLRGGLGDDALFGEAGSDTADYSDYQQGIAVTLPSGTTCASGGNAPEGTDRWDNAPFAQPCPTTIERVIGGAGGDTISMPAVAGPTPTIAGLGGNDTITLTGSVGAVATGGDGDDTVNGGAGDDALDGGIGADVVDGNEGTDLVTYAGRPEGVAATLGGGAVSGSAADGGGKDSIVDAEALEGGAGGDVLTGGPGADRLLGAGGDDTLRGLGGADVLEGGDGADRADYGERAAPVTVILDGAANDGEAGENDRIAGDVENATGGAAGDRLTGSGGPNDLTGGDGDDQLTGLSGSDRLDAGAGADTIEARDGETDAVACGAGTDAVSADTTDTLDACEAVTTAGVLGADADGDGATVPADCDDANAKIKPGALEVPGNKVDENCDGVKARFPAIPARVQVGASSTRIVRLSVLRVPKGARIVVRCKGKKGKGGCPFSTKRVNVKKAKKRVALKKLFKGRRLKAGTAVTLIVTAPGTIGRLERLVFRKGKLPKRTTGCVTPAGKRTRC